MNDETNNYTEQLDTDKTQLDTCLSELQQSKDRLLYLNAEFDNYKKRIEKERISWMQHSQAVLLTDFLPIIDDVERALAQIHTQPISQELQAFIQGLELIAKSFYKLLKKYDIQEITELKQFNPEFHEAIMEVEGNGQPSGEIASVFEKGYLHKGSVLRPAKVSVIK